MTEKIIFRTATKEDLLGILEIYNEAILNTTAVYEYEPYKIEYIVHWFDEKQQKHFPILIAEVNKRVAGFATYGPFRLRPAYQFSAEHSVYVHSDFRRKGLGKILLQKIIDAARANNFHTLLAGIDAENKVSIQLHGQFGFEIVGCIKQVGYKFDRWLDLVFMQLIL